MKKSIPFSFICVIFLGLSIAAHAQQNVARLDYDKYSKQIKEEVWGWNRPEFNNRTIPAEYANASAVVIAVHYEIALNAKNKFNLFGSSNKITNQVLYYSNTMRRMVKLNDKSSIEKYSEFSFQQYAAAWGYQTRAAAMTVVGVRIIKPDGTIKEVDASDEVEMEGTKKNRSRKLAIADLQVGDIIDYFVHYTEQMDYKNIDPLLFVFAGSNPILSYSIHASVDKRLTTEYRTTNGAPDFLVEKKDGNFDLSTIQTNIAPIANEQWISTGRQLPFISLSVLYNSSSNLYHPASARKAGVHKDVDYGQIISDYKWNLFSYGDRYKASNDPYYKQIDDVVSKYKAAKPNVSSDSVACLIYYAMQHFYLNDWDAEHIEVSNNRNSYSIPHMRFIAYFSKMLLNYDIKSNMIFAPSTFGPSLSNIANVNSLEAFVSTQSASPIVFATPSIFTDVNSVPGEYEGQEAILFNTNKYKEGDFKVEGKDKKITLPLSTAKQNMRSDNMQVSIDLSNPLELQIDRTSTISGHLKGNFQQLLLLYEQYEASNRTAFAVGKNMFDEMTDKRKTKALVQEYEAAFAEAREKQKDYFKEEVNLMYDEDAKEVKSFAIINPGMPIQKSNMEYQVNYTMDGFVHKAGNNYTIDIGKLGGPQLRLEPKERTRNMDVYMSYARTYVTNISLTIPSGYTVEGLDAIKYQVNNSSGKFIVTATLNGNTLQVTSTKEYSQAFVPVANWQQLLEVIDGANDFYGKSIILRKNGAKK